MTNYDTIAQEYAQLTEAVERETRQHFYSLLPGLEGKLILDVGCGSGHDAREYARQGAEVYGLDISQKELCLAREQGQGTFTQGNMEHLPYRDNTFNAVTSVYALQAAEEVTQSILEMIRVARPGATITILAKHPIRNLLESHVNDQQSDYFGKRMVTSRIFRGAITLMEPGHTLEEYLSPKILQRATLEYFEERSDYPASEQVLGMKYPTYLILQFRHGIA